MALVAPAKATVGVVFSKDRPLQLDAALTSLRRHWRSASGSWVRVLFATSTPAQASLYRLVASEHPEVEFVREQDFKQDLIDIVQGSEHVLFLVDDTLVVRDVDLDRACAVLDDRPLAVGFSLRLGRNTSYCYTMDRPQALPAFDDIGGGILEFSWPDAEADFGYPLEVSSSVYRTSDVGPLLTRLDYRNPNTLEAELARDASVFTATRGRLLCLEASAAFSVPANLVQNAWRNRISDDGDTSVDALAQRYASGERIAVGSYDGFTPNACHQETPFVFEKRLDIPTVSVVIPCYNQAGFLVDAVESVVAQTFPDWEVLIVDDGSPDETAEVAATLITRFPERRVRLLRQANGGLSKARNAGIAAALGRYILPLDADDAIAPRMLERATELLDSDGRTAIAYTDIELFGNESGRIQAGKWSTERVCALNQFAYCSVYRREVWEAVGGYNPNMAYGYEDWDFWIGAAERGYLARRIAEPLFRYRIRLGSMYASAKAHDAELRAQIRANHPDLFTRRRRLLRWSMTAARRVLYRFQTLLANRKVRHTGA